MTLTIRPTLMRIKYPLCVWRKKYMRFVSIFGMGIDIGIIFFSTVRSWKYVSVFHQNVCAWWNDDGIVRMWNAEIWLPVNKIFLYTYIVHTSKRHMYHLTDVWKKKKKKTIKMSNADEFVSVYDMSFFEHVHSPSRSNIMRFSICRMKANKWKIVDLVHGSSFLTRCFQENSLFYCVFDAFIANIRCILFRFPR